MYSSRCSYQILMKLEFRLHIFEKILKISSLRKTPPVEAEFFHADRHDEGKSPVVILLKRQKKRGKDKGKTRRTIRKRALANLSRIASGNSHSGRPVQESEPTTTR